MSLQKIRINQHMTRRELAQKASVNFRALQDYEQGQKKLSSASGDVLLRLSTVLGCSAEELLVPDDFPDAPLLPGNTVDVVTIQSQRFYCEKYQAAVDLHLLLSCDELREIYEKDPLIPCLDSILMGYQKKIELLRLPNKLKQ